MIDNAQLIETIEKQIAETIEKFVLDDLDNDLRQSQINNIIQRSVEKTTKELLQSDNDKLAEIIADNIKNNSELTNSIIADNLPQIGKSIETHLKPMLETHVSDQITSPEWQTRIQNTVNQTVNRISARMVSALDSDKVISDAINESLNLNDKQLKDMFPGIQDNSRDGVELVIMPEHVVVENKLASRQIKNVGNIETESLSVSDLSVTGSINVDNRSWQNLANVVSEKTFEKIGDQFVSDTTDKVLEIASKSGIEFDNVRLGNQLLVDGNQLSHKITDTQIEKTGTLKSLEVAGNADFYDTLHVLNGRIGVNTETPDMAINVWDEEVSVSIGKISADRAFIGSSRKHEIALGVNRQGDIVIDSNGVTTINRLRVGKNAIDHADQVPGWSGTRGDFVINTSPGKDEVFAWICLGDYRWKALKSA